MKWSGKIVDIDGIDELGMAIGNEQKNFFTQELQKLVDVAREVMAEEDINASYSLSQSVEPRMIDKDIAGIAMNDYWKYVEHGVAGVKGGMSTAGFKFDKKPALRDFIRWVGFRSIGDKSNIIQNANKYRNIVYYYGRKAKPFIDKIINRYLNS